MASQIDMIRGALVDDHGIWTVRGRVRDPVTNKVKNKSKSTGFKVKDKTKRKAECAMRAIIAEWERESVMGVAFVASTNDTVEECLNRWLDKKQLTIRANTLKSYRDSANAHIIPRLGALKIKQLTRYHLERYFASLQGVISPNTMRRHRVILRGFLEDAVYDGIITINPIDHVQLPKNEKYERQYIPESEVGSFLEQAMAAAEPVRSAIILALVYGLRRSEICGLRWSDIDFDAGVMRIRNTYIQSDGLKIEAETTKSRASARDIALVPATVPYFEALQTEQLQNGVEKNKVCIFPDGYEVLPETITRKCKRFIADCGFPGVTLHGLRHTASTIMARKVTPKQLQAFLGHERVETTYNIYTHIDSTDRVATAAAMDAFLRDEIACSENVLKTGNFT